ATPMDTLVQVLYEEVVPPSKLQPQLPRDVETICLKCLEKEPARRYVSAAALAEDLHRFETQEPITARPVGRAERSWRWCRRNKAVAGLLAAVLLLLLVGLAGSTVAAFRFQAERDSGLELLFRADQAEANLRRSLEEVNLAERAAREKLFEAY